MSEQRLEATVPGAQALELAVRGGDAIALKETGALWRLLRAAATESPTGASVPADLPTRVAPLLPVVAPPAEPVWLRAEEMLDEAAACPGERLLASTLNMGAHWWRIDDLRAALGAVRGTVASGATLSAGLDAGQIIQACAAIDSALARIDANAWVQVRDTTAPER